MLDFWVWLYSQPGIGSKKIKTLVSEYGTNVDQKLWPDIAVNTGRSKCTYALEISKGIAEKKMVLESCKVNVIPFWSKKYPSKLKQIPDYPAFLFCRGRWEHCLFDNKIVAIVGTRAMTSYGKAVLKRTLKPLMEREITIVSGLASGIDAEAHRLILEDKNFCSFPVVVLPGGPCGGFPEVNRYLYRKILNSGLIISEYFPGTLIKPGMFVSRNRIVAGLSDCVVVIEAPQKSGALLTADFALDYNREVGAVPGSVFCRTSEGTNNLLKQGAYVIRDGYDILEMINYVYDQNNKS